MISHEAYMKRAIALAKKGTRRAYPNPSVGAVIVCNDQIIGEGYTSAYGGAHAEVNAVNSVKDSSLLSQSTAYVTLEPCAHYGKTPPCSRMLVAKGIKKVVIGCIDSFAKVAGKGIQILKDGGVEVVVGVLEQECLELHKRFLTFHNKKRPYIVLKWAETKDGFIDINRDVTQQEEAKPTWISNTQSRQYVHKLRAQEHAILVGTNTAIKDNPSLTTRDYGGLSPVRLLLDKSLRVPYNYTLFNGEVDTIVFTEETFFPTNNTEFVTVDFLTSVVSQVLSELYLRNLQSLVVEGGKQLLQSFIDAGLWDEALVFEGAAFFGDGVEAPVLEQHFEEVLTLNTNRLKIYRNKNS